MKVTYSTLKTMESIITDDYEHCIECGRKAEHCHHVCESGDKRWSEYFRLMIPMCAMCHMELHSNQEMNEWYKRLAQEKFIETYPDENWMKYFRRNYL